MAEPIENKILIEARGLIPDGEQVAIDLQLKAHSTLLLVGPCSSRLCRYLRALAGVDAAIRGDLELFGRSVRRLNKRDWREQRKQIGYVARNAPILSVLRGIDNVMLPALYHKIMSRNSARKKALELIAQVGCLGDIHKLPAFLSRQQRLQLAIARAVILDPDILFIEEPFSGLSLAEQQPIYQYLTKAAHSRTIILSTHNLKLARELSTQILFIDDNQVEHFTSWTEFSGCEHEQVRHYLEQYRQQYQPDQSDG